MLNQWPISASKIPAMCTVYLSGPGHTFIINQQAQTVFNCVSANEKLDMLCALTIVTAF